MTTFRISERAREVLAGLKAERGERLTFLIDGGCCEGTAPHLYEDAIVTSAAERAGEIDGVPVYLQSAMIEPYRDANVILDVVDEPLSEAMSIETALGVRFVLRE